jgi:hypothetical protein
VPTVAQPSGCAGAARTRGDLVILEMRLLLGRHLGTPIANSLPVLRPELPDFAQSARGLSLIPIAVNPRSE